MLHNRRSIWWVDNEAARFSLIKGQSGSESMNQLVREYYRVDSDYPTFGWVERVPSFSNPSDSPSRFKPELAKALFRSADALPFVHSDELIARLMQSTAGRV